MVLLSTSGLISFSLTDLGPFLFASEHFKISFFLSRAEGLLWIKFEGFWSTKMVNISTRSPHSEEDSVSPGGCFNFSA